MDDDHLHAASTLSDELKVYCAITTIMLLLAFYHQDMPLFTKLVYIVVAAVGAALGNGIGCLLICLERRVVRQNEQTSPV